MNKETAIRKINTVGKVGSILSKIMLIIAAIGTACALIGGISMLAVPKDLFHFTSMGNADLEIRIDEQSNQLPDPSDETALAQLYSDTVKVLNNLDFAIGGADYQTRAINISEDYQLIDVEMNGALSEITPRRVAGLLWAAAVYLAFLTVLLILVHRLCRQFRNCTSPFASEIIKSMQHIAWVMIPWAFADTFFRGIAESAFSAKISVAIGIDLSTILAILLIFALTFIFKYGAILQTESDETL